MSDPAAPHVAAELEPRFLVTVTLDGDDDAEIGTDLVRIQLTDALARLQQGGAIRAYTIEQAP